jgi:hypothetical protein
LKKINLSSGWPGIEKSEVCDCGTRRSRFRKSGAFLLPAPFETNGECVSNFVWRSFGGASFQPDKVCNSPTRLYNLRHEDVLRCWRSFNHINLMSGHIFTIGFYYGNERESKKDKTEQ